MGGCVPCIPLRSPRRLPEWFFENLDAYACSAQTSNMLYGASLAIRSSILKKFYTDALSVKLKGRTKDSLDSGEDNLLCNFVKKQGYTLIPDNTPFCHFMESKNHTNNSTKETNHWSSS